MKSGHFWIFSLLLDFSKLQCIFYAVEVFSWLWITRYSSSLTLMTQSWPISCNNCDQNQSSICRIDRTSIWYERKTSVCRRKEVKLYFQVQSKFNVNLTSMSYTFMKSVCRSLNVKYGSAKSMTRICQIYLLLSKCIAYMTSQLNVMLIEFRYQYDVNDVKINFKSD